MKKIITSVVDLAPVSTVTTQFLTFKKSFIEDIIAHSDNLSYANLTQRKCRAGMVKKHTEKMLNGTWIWDNGESIKMNEKFECIDGQHRLAAIKDYMEKSGVETASYSFTWGITNEKSFQTYDIGLVRRASQFMEGADKNNNLDGIVKTALAVKDGTAHNHLYMDTVFGHKMDMDDVLNALEKYPEIRNISRKIAKDFRGLPSFWRKPSIIGLFTGLIAFKGFSYPSDYKNIITPFVQVLFFGNKAPAEQVNYSRRKINLMLKLNDQFNKRKDWREMLTRTNMSNYIAWAWAVWMDAITIKKAQYPDAGVIDEMITVNQYQDRSVY